MDERTHANGGVAQLGEHLLCKQGVIGSNPFISTSGLKPQTKRVQREAKAEGCIHADQVKTSARRKTGARAGSVDGWKAGNATCIKAQPFTRDR